MYRQEFVLNPATGQIMGAYRTPGFSLSNQCVVFRGNRAIAVVADADEAQKIIDALNKADAS
jgi:hypothetical protein